MAEKKKSNKMYSALFWANIKALWESGKFASVEEFKNYGDSTFKKFPSVSIINKRISSEGWDKNKAKEELEERTQRSYAELFEKHGCGDEEVVKRIAFGINAPERAVTAISEYSVKHDGKIDGETLSEFAKMMNYYLKVAVYFIAERNKMVGGYAASKHKISTKLTAFDTKNMSPEEAAAEHERIHENFVAAGLCK